jgi:hypothetical protein
MAIRLADRLIQAAQEAAAMARGEAVPGSIIHTAPAQIAAVALRPGPGAAPSGAPVRDADGDPA